MGVKIPPAMTRRVIAAHVGLNNFWPIFLENGLSRDVNRTQKSNANAMRMRKFFENPMRMRCDARKKNLVRCECDAIFLSHFFAFSQNAKNRIMRKIAKCENAKNAIFASAQPFSKTPCSATPCSKLRVQSWACSLENGTDSIFYIIFALRIQPAGLSWACLSWPEISWVDLS